MKKLIPILLTVTLLLVGCVLASEISIYPRYYRNGQEIVYYEQNYDAISFDFTQNNLYNITILNITPDILNKNLITQNGEVFAKSSIIPKKYLNSNTIWISISAIENNSIIYEEALIKIDLNNKNVLVSIGESIYKENYEIGLFIFFILILLITFIIIKMRRKR